MHAFVFGFACYLLNRVTNACKTVCDGSIKLHTSRANNAATGL